MIAKNNALARSLLGEKAPEKEPKTRKVIIIRHGTTALNSDDVNKDRIKGWEDIPLDKNGEKEAHELKDKMDKHKHRPEVITSCNLQRGSKTADIIGDGAKIKKDKYTPAFLPWNTGHMKGMLRKDVMPILAKHVDLAPNTKIKGGESFNQFHKRFFKGLHDVLNRHKGPVAIVTHSHNEQLMTGWKKSKYRSDGVFSGRHFKNAPAKPGSIIEYDVPMSALKRLVKK